jgi:hypothetical protein
MAKVNTNDWREFEIGDLFDVSRPAGRTSTDYIDGDQPFVASGNFNNGVSRWVEPRDGENPEAGNCITVSPLDGAAFYQPVSFLGRGGAGSAILILRNEDLNLMSGLFVCAVIRRSLQQLSYSDQLSSSSIVTKRIALPVTRDGVPDWSYMEEYMRKASESANSRLDSLQGAIAF